MRKTSITVATALTAGLAGIAIGRLSCTLSAITPTGTINTISYFSLFVAERTSRYMDDVYVLCLGSDLRPRGGVEVAATTSSGIVPTKTDSNGVARAGASRDMESLTIMTTRVETRGGNVVVAIMR